MSSWLSQLGQLLNFMTYYRLTPCGVHYGAQCDDDSAAILVL